MTTPNPAAFDAAVRDYLAPHRQQFNYDQMLLTFLSSDRFRQWAQVIASYASVSGARFFSSGCGFGGSLLAYHDAGAVSVTGAEVDPEYVRFSRLRTAEIPTATVVHTGGGRTPFADQSFDLIESMDVIEHARDPRAYLAELRRLLTPDGAVLLATPNRLWPVEQHLEIAGPPLLPIGIADTLFTAAARLPGVGQERRFRYQKLAGMRTQNMSLRTLRHLANDLGLLLRLIRPADHADDWPLPRQPSWIEALADHRVAKFAAPTKTLVCLLTKK